MTASLALGILVVIGVGLFFVCAVFKVFGLGRSTFRGGF